MNDRNRQDYDLASAIAEIEDFADRNRADKNKNDDTSKKSEKKRGDYHKNHRKRIDKKVEQYGFETLPDHEQLEYILFSVIPRGDTNILAHRLLEEFGTLQGVLNADKKHIQKVEGVGYRTACFLSNLNDVAGLILRNQQNGPYVLDTSDRIRGYISTFYIGRLNECSYIFMLDATKRLKSVLKMSDGTTNQTHIYPQRVAQQAVINSASEVIIAHNHPSGTIEPSTQDINVTKAVEAALMAVGVKLHDSVIIGGNNYFSFKDSGYLFKLRWDNDR